jgi:hypothetical protein
LLSLVMAATPFLILICRPAIYLPPSRHAKPVTALTCYPLERAQKKG